MSRTAPTGEEVCYSDDEEMKRLLIRKRQREEEEVYNAPETMAVKRRAVKEAAKRTPVPKTIPNLTFDDEIEPSEDGNGHGNAKGNEDGADAMVVVKPVDAVERGSNSAQKSVGIATTKAGAAAEAEAEVAGEIRSKNKVNKAKRLRAKPSLPVRARKSQRHAKQQSHASKTAGSVPIAVRSRKNATLTTTTTQKIQIEPIRWAKKSDQGARRSRRRLRRLLNEEEALLSSQLQVS